MAKKNKPSSPNLYESPLTEEFSSDGYKKALKPRHIRMIALGGAMGTGLFLGAGSRLHEAGPSLAIIYIICGICAFMVLRAIGELAMYRPSSGSFVTYAREFMGEGAAYIAGWFFFLNWVTCGIVDVTAIAVYLHHWPFFQPIPQWLLALFALITVGGINLLGVKHFGEIEFWLAFIKVMSLVVFLVIGTVVLVSAYNVGGITPGFHLISENGGWFPNGITTSLMLIQGVVFAYAATELVAIAAGECKNARKVIPNAVNSVIWRIMIFYAGSITLLVCLLPWTAYNATTSPFVTFLDKLGVPWSADIMNFVVLTAALSSLNSGLYSTGRILRALALGGSAPSFMTQLSRNAVPYKAIILTLSIDLIGIFLNYLMPQQIFEIVLSISSLAILGMWMSILVCQTKLHKAIKIGKIKPTGFPMPGSPWSNWITIAFLIMVLVMMGFDYPAGTFAIASIPFLSITFLIGWWMIKRNHKNS